MAEAYPIEGPIELEHAAKPKRRGRKHAEVANDPNDVFAREGARPIEEEIRHVAANAAEAAPAPVVETAALNGGQAAKRAYVPDPDPFGFEGKLGKEGNRVRLLKSESDEAWVIRFDKNPSTMEGYSKENPHPVIKMLKESGYRWGFDSNDGKGGWGKAWQGDPYGTDHMEARRVLTQAAEMVGATVEQGQAR